MKFGLPGRGNRSMTAPEFGQAYREMLTTLPIPPLGAPKIDVHVHTAAFEWVQYTARASGVGQPGHIWERAMRMAGFNMLAGELGFDAYLMPGSQGAARAPGGGERHNLPPLPNWLPSGRDTYIGIWPTPEQYNIAMRYLSDPDVPMRAAETLMDNGVRILGALAVMPPDSMLAVRDEQNMVYGIKPPFPLTLAEPYPADLNFGLPHPRR